MPRRLDKTLVDYLVIAISPALIITLIASLVFFLLQIFYRGDYGIRLHVIFGLFVLAAVLVTRIAIEEGREHAQLFSIPLGIVTFLALNRFVQFQSGSLGGLSWAVNLLLIAVVWWCADKLTWDCTLIDETERDTGEGLLESVGLDKAESAATEPDVAREGDLEGVTSPEAAKAGFWQRYRERRRRPHAPGVWVVYFSLAALPMFGVGQWFIPASDPAGRRYVFGLLTVYVASGLGLLLTTSFLGLRRYLRQRRLEMPAAMAGLWLAVGCALIVVLLAVTALLPRPGAEYAVSQLPFTFGSPDHKPSRIALGNDGVEEGEDGAAAEGEPSQQESGSGDREDEDEDEDEADADSGSESQHKEASGDRKSGSGKATDRGRGDEQPDDRQEPSEQSQGRPPDKDRATEGDRETDETHETDKDDEPEASESKPTESKPTESKPTESKPEEDRRGGSRMVPRPAHQALDSLQKSGGWLLTLVKWLIYGILILAGLYWLWRSRAALLAGLQGFLAGVRQLWQNLFGGSRAQAEEEAAAAAGPRRPRLRSFADFADPFAAGTAGRYSADELIRYSFEALEAWAREHGCARGPEQTPHEFSRNVGVRTASLSRDARVLADLYCQAAYAPGTVAVARVDCLERFWRQLRCEPTVAGVKAGG